MSLQHLTVIVADVTVTTISKVAVVNRHTKYSRPNSKKFSADTGRRAVSLQRFQLS